MKKIRKRTALVVISLLVASSMIGMLAVTRLARALSIGEFVRLNQEGNNVTLVVYGEPEGARPVFEETLQYFTAENLEFKGFIPGAVEYGGPSADLWVKFGYLLYENMHADVADLTLQVDVEDTVVANIYAREGAIDLEFWEQSSGLPAFNVTALLTKDVEVNLKFKVLPIPGLESGAYYYGGSLFEITVCVLKPLGLTVQNPQEGPVNRGDVVPIELLARHAYGINVESAEWRLKSFRQDIPWGEGYHEFNEDEEGWNSLGYDENVGLWTGNWDTTDYRAGEYVLGFQIKGVEEGSDQYWDSYAEVIVKVEGDPLDFLEGERIILSRGDEERWLPAGEPYKIHHGFLLDGWSGRSPEEQEGWLDDNNFRFDLEIDGNVRELTKIERYERWSFYLVEEELKLMHDVKTKIWCTQLEESETTGTHTYRGVWTFLNDDGFVETLDREVTVHYEG